MVRSLIVSITLLIFTLAAALVGSSITLLSGVGGTGSGDDSTLMPMPPGRPD